MSEMKSGKQLRLYSLPDQVHQVLEDIQAQFDRIRELANDTYGQRMSVADRMHQIDAFAERGQLLSASVQKTVELGDFSARMRISKYLIDNPQLSWQPHPDTHPRRRFDVNYPLLSTRHGSNR